MLLFTLFLGKSSLFVFQSKLATDCGVIIVKQRGDLRVKKLFDLASTSLLSLILVLLSICGPANAKGGPYAWPYADLQVLRIQRVAQLEDILSRFEEKARAAASDKVVVSVLELSAFHAQALRQGAVDGEFEAKIHEVEQSFRRYYVENYFLFYDILFIDTTGSVVHSLRGESDLHTTLTAGKDALSPLGSCIAKRPNSEVFIDYHDYTPSSEPAAFLVEPIRKDDRLLGWIALQCSVNKINALFAPTGEDYETMETLLVNEQGLMLTDSQFFSGSSVLRAHLNFSNVPLKFAQGQGRMEVTDYRDQECLTAFQVVDFKGVQWLVVAKVDKDEVVTREFVLHKRYYAQRLLLAMAEKICPSMRLPVKGTKNPGVLVDMDEFYRAECSLGLRTFGISTCTGFLAISPRKFAYLAHVSNKDHAYGGTETNLLDQILENIERFDVSRNEKRQLSFLIVAPQLDGLEGALDQLLDRGYLLSQVRVLSCPQARTGEIRYDCDGTVVTWTSPSLNPLGSHKIEDAANLGEIIEAIIAQGTPE
ncbi:cache domain-containing protein [Desulfomicrobium sp. ZS1]|uniref:cache domain-containing protein n=1 Tax=Desulfomicrobium sp. ZS1 TaxID=2952228 RepID=UPI0020B1E88A|nr:cache domain-containing protein [Desulfomicrobium sp. ZS1]UTF51854.1 cache domain-containing protein [Desulfomicrobium sp. ZS1]